MLLCAPGASKLRNMLAGKGFISADENFGNVLQSTKCVNGQEF